MRKRRRVAIVAGLGGWMAFVAAGLGLVLVLVMHERVALAVALCSSIFAILFGLLIVLALRPDLAYPSQGQLDDAARRAPPGGVPVFDPRARQDRDHAGDDGPVT